MLGGMTEKKAKEKQAGAIIRAGRIELSQQEDGDVLVLYRGKLSQEVAMHIPASKLERWALRQLREDIFAV